MNTTSSATNGTTVAINTEDEFWRLQHSTDPAADDTTTTVCLFTAREERYNEYCMNGLKVGVVLLL